jgi:uncharacterized protein (DUF362 family)
MISRRRILVGVGAALGAGVGARVIWDKTEGFGRATTFIGKCERYDGTAVADVIARGLAELELPKDWARGKTVLLKPNLVEPSLESPHINTHPMVLWAAANVFRNAGAREVLVAEGQGHIRDSHLVLEQSGLAPMLADTKMRFVDLNHDELASVKNASDLTKLAELVLPVTLKKADIVVSIAKMKTHHWAGATLTMKNLFGVMPGIVYGWPKNVLHHQGIYNSIVDITKTVQPQLAIVDGIVGMEGDGPIMGTPKPSNLLVIGTNLAAVDATAARLMDFEPNDIPYLRLASERIGPIAQSHIAQRGETIESMRQHYALMDDPRLKEFRKL